MVRQFVVLVVLLVPIVSGSDEAKTSTANTTDLSDVPTSNTSISDCPDGWFGEDCERECHCMSTPCKSDELPVKCSDGCVRGWLGQACDYERIKPEASYYCLQGNRDVPHVLIRLKTNGIEYINIYAWQQGETAVACRNIIRTRFDRGKFSKTPKETVDMLWVDFSPEGMFTPQSSINTTHICLSIPSKNNETQWLLTVRESPDVTLENDLDLVITCGRSEILESKVAHNFSVAKIPPEADRMYQEPATLEDDVTLTLVDANTGVALTEGELGTPVKLKITFGLKQGSAIRAVRPYSCKATSRGTGSATLLSSKGCSYSVVSEFQKISNHTMETDWFPLFSVGTGERKDMKIVCRYDICFQEDACKSKCGQDGASKRQVRRSADVIHGNSILATDIIHFL